MVPKPLKRQPPPRNNRPLLLSLVASVFINIGSAFIPSSPGLIHAASAMSADNNNPKNAAAADGGSGSKPLSAAAAEGDESENSQRILQLPEASNDPSIPSIKLGESIRFEEMGPVIINADGTTRRIDNWDQMTEQEQEVAWRRISKRNEERRKALLEQQQQQQNEMDKTKAEE